MYKQGDEIDHLVLYERDGWICGICGCPIDRTKRFPDKQAATVDHKIPITCGGAHTWANVQAAHGQCNEDKADNLTLDYYVE